MNVFEFELDIRLIIENGSKDFILIILSSI